MSVDMLIDWEGQEVSIYVDGEGIAAVPFFTKRATKLQNERPFNLWTNTWRNLTV